MKSLKLFFFVAFGFVLFSCERDLNVPLPEHQSRLVINGYLYAGKPVDIYVTRSYGIIEKPEIKDILVGNALVEILEGGKILDTLVYRDTVVQNPFLNGSDQVLGKYYSETVIPESGKSYTVRVSHPQYETATATTTIPRAPKVTSVKIDQDVYIEQYTDFTGVVYGNGQSLIRVTVDDFAGEKNYYDFEIEIDYDVPGMPGSPFTDIVSTSNNAIRNPEGGYRGDRRPFTDENFDGQTKTLDILAYLPFNYSPINERNLLKINATRVKAKLVNDDYYRFKSKFDLQLDTRNLGDFGIVPVEAIVVYTNVEGGYGILGGFNEAVFEF
ncbi:MAG: DUF4249 domain-containing protein [Bacteroidia bacterium]